MSKHNSNSSFHKQRVRERIDDEDAEWHALWKPGETSFAAFVLDDALANGDATALAEQILGFTLFRWQIMLCRDAQGIERKVAMVEAHVGDHQKLENFARQICTAFRGLEAAFMHGGKARALGSVDDGAADLGAVDPSDFEALALRLLGDGSEVLRLEEPKLAELTDIHKMMGIHLAYNTLDYPGSEVYLGLAQSFMEDPEAWQ